MNATEGASLDAQGNIDADTPCRRCAYNLRGISPAGKCPECGAPAAVSIQGDLLVFSDPNWVNGLARGIRVVEYGLLTLLTAIFSPCAGGMVGLTLFVVLSVGGGAVCAVGAWLLTRPEPNELSGMGRARARLVTRLCVIAWFVGVAAAGALYFPAWGAVIVSARGNVFITGGNTALHRFASASIGLAVLAGCAGLLATLTYLESLALRVNDVELARQSRLYRRILSVMWLATFVIGAFVSGSGAIFGLKRVFQAWLFAVGAVVLVMGLMVAALFVADLVVRFRRALCDNAAFARDTWERSRGDHSTDNAELP